MLMSAGGFAIYRGYLPVYKMLIPLFGSLDKFENREKILQVWLRSKGFRRSGLDAAFVRDKVLHECKNAGDFIRITMDEITRQQGANRWAFYDPDALLHMPRIKSDIPEGIFVHIVRDGRDIALSLKKMEGFRPFPWDRKQRSLLETGLYWEWMVRRGRSHGRHFPTDYIEIRYEELVSDPETVLRRVGEFVEHDLDYGTIQKAGLGRIRESNSSFLAEPQDRVNPVNRWKEKLTSDETAELEAIIGEALQEFGYELNTLPGEHRASLINRWMRSFYPVLLDTKLFLKMRTPFGRLADLSAMELDSEEQRPVSRVEL